MRTDICCGVFSDVVVAPPFIYIDSVLNTLTKRIEVSAQNSWTGKGGAFTGEIRHVFSHIVSYHYLQNRMGLRVNLVAPLWAVGSRFVRG